MRPEITLPKLEPQEVVVWCRKTSDLTAEAVLEAGRHLSAEETLSCDRLHFPNDRRDYAAAHDLLRRALSCYADVNPAEWVFTPDDRGKPSIHLPETYRRSLTFNLSHSRDFVACGIAPGDSVGVDIECADRAVEIEEIAGRYFSTHEAAWLRDGPEETRHIHFTELWTLKESFLKAIGLGLSGSLATASFQLQTPGRIRFDPPPGFARAEWHFALFGLDAAARIAVAVARNEPPRFTVHCEDSPSALALLAVSA